MAGSLLDALVQKNLDYLAENQLLFQDLAGQFAEKVQPAWLKRLDRLRQGEALQVNGIRYHSTRSAEREAERLARSYVQPETSHLLLLGAGRGFVLQSLAGLDQVESVLLLEPDLEILYYLLATIDLKQLSERLRVFIFFPVDVNSADLDPVLPYLQGKSAASVNIVSFHPALKARPSMYQALFLRVKNLFEKRSINQATIIKFQDLWNKNISLNSRQVIEGIAMADLADYSYKTVVIAGAGPSLASSMNDIRDLRNKFILIAADTALIPFLKNDIVPDIVVAADPQWYTWLFALYPGANQPLWLLDPVVSHLLVHHLATQKARMAWWQNPFYLDQLVQKYFGKRGEIAHGGSVSTNAFDFALKAGAERIILIGQDLSFSDKMAHVKGAALENAVFFRQGRFFNMQQHNFHQLSALPRIYIEDLRGKKDSTFTNAKMQVFIEWFELQALRIKQQNLPVELYNASTAGARLKGFEHQPLQKILQQTPPSEPFAIKAEPGANPAQLEKLSNHIEHLVSDIGQVKRLYAENLQGARQLEKQVNKGLIDKMATNDRRASQYNEANNIISLGAQQSILKISEFDEKADGIGSSLQLYQALVKSADLMLYLFKKLAKQLA